MDDWFTEDNIRICKSTFSSSDPEGRNGFCGKEAIFFGLNPLEEDGSGVWLCDECIKWFKRG
jgi:hypothetical protein